jgi:hypothetical protein
VPNVTRKHLLERIKSNSIKTNVEVATWNNLVPNAEPTGTGLFLRRTFLKNI